MKKNKLSLIILITIAYFAIVFIYFFNNNESNNVLVAFLDIDQGDSALINLSNNQQIIIDGGPSKTVVNNISKYLPWWDRQIDLILLTHPHKDHITGLNQILSNYNIDNVVYTGVSYQSDVYESWLEAIKQEKANLIIVEKPQVIDFVDCQLYLLYPDINIYEQVIDNINNTSIVSKLVCGEVSFLFTGDIEKETEDYMLLQHELGNIDLQADVLKVAHHGSKTSTSLEFLQAVKPELAIISFEPGNKYGLPSQKVIKRLEDQNITVLNTSESDVLVYTDGQSFWLE